LIEEYPVIIRERVRSDGGGSASLIFPRTGLKQIALESNSNIAQQRPCENGCCGVQHHDAGTTTAPGYFAVQDTRID